MFQRQVVIVVLLFCHFGINVANVVEGSGVQRKKLYYPEENPIKKPQTQMGKIRSSLSDIYSNIDGSNLKRSNFIHHHGQGGGDSGLSANIGNALGVAGLGLLFINQLSVALHIPFLIPILLIPLTFVIVATLIAHGDNGGSGSSGGVIR